MSTIINAEVEKNYKKSLTMAYMAFSQVFEFDIKRILNDQGIDRIAIYGMGEEGKLLYWMFRKAHVNIGFITDKEYNNIVMETTPVLPPENVASNVRDIDLIVVSSDYYFDEIRNDLGSELDVPVISARILLENCLMCTKK